MEKCKNIQSKSIVKKEGFKMRKFLSFLTALAVIFSVCGSAFAVEDVNMLDENDYEALNDTDAEIINRVGADEYEMPDAID